MHVRVHLLLQVEGDIKVFKHTKKINSLIMHYCKSITGHKSVFNNCPNLDQRTNLSLEECNKLTDTHTRKAVDAMEVSVWEVYSLMKK